MLHIAGFVHRDLSPGNIIVVDGKAKISDLEFAKARKVADLQRLTKLPEGCSSPAVVDTRTVSYFFVVFGPALTPSQGTLKFAAVEMVDGYYRFTPSESHAGSTGDRVFLYTPLHDYESVWWIATWVIFSCRLNTSEDDATVRNGLPSNRADFFSIPYIFGRCSMLLPKKLHPLVRILDEMRMALLKKYREYEKDFDSPCILDAVPDLIQYLQKLVKAAQAINIKPLRVLPTVERSDMLINVQESESEGNGFKGGKVEAGEVRTGSRKRRHSSSPDSDPRRKRRMGDN